MNVVIRLTLLGALSILSACQPEVPPPAPAPAPQPKEETKPVDRAPVPSTACRGCQWKNFLNKPNRVERLECTNGGKPEHCHLAVEDGMPKRLVTLTFDKTFGSYNWKLVSPEPGQEKNRMDCPNLAPNPNNDRVIEGTCIIFNSDQGPAVHFFRATLLPFEENPQVPSIYFEFGHTPFDDCAKPAHEGGGHVHLNN